MKLRTNLKGGGVGANHNEAQASGMGVRTRVKA